MDYFRGGHQTDTRKAVHEKAFNPINCKNGFVDFSQNNGK